MHSGAQRRIRPQARQQTEPPWRPAVLRPTTRLDVALQGVEQGLAKHLVGRGHVQQDGLQAAGAPPATRHTHASSTAQACASGCTSRGLRCASAGGAHHVGGNQQASGRLGEALQHLRGGRGGQQDAVRSSVPCSKPPAAPGCSDCKSVLRPKRSPCPGPLRGGRRERGSAAGFSRHQAALWVAGRQTGNPGPTALPVRPPPRSPLPSDT